MECKFIDISISRFSYIFEFDIDPFHCISFTIKLLFDRTKGHMYYSDSVTYEV